MINGFYIAFFVLYGLNIINVCFKHGIRRVPPVNAGQEMLGIIIELALLFFAGFFSVKALSWPQSITVLRWIIVMLYAVVKDGKKVEKDYNVWTGLIGVGISVFPVIAFLYAAR